MLLCTDQHVNLIGSLQINLTQPILETHTSSTQRIMQELVEGHAVTNSQTEIKSASFLHVKKKYEKFFLSKGELSSCFFCNSSCSRNLGRSCTQYTGTELQVMILSPVVVVFCLQHKESNNHKQSNRTLRTWTFHIKCISNKERWEQAEGACVGLCQMHSRKHQLHPKLSAMNNYAFLSTIVTPCPSEGKVLFLKLLLLLHLLFVDCHLAA